MDCCKTALFQNKAQNRPQKEAKQLLLGPISLIPSVFEWIAIASSFCSEPFLCPNKKAAKSRFFSLALAAKVCYNSGEGRRLSCPGRKGDFKQMKIAVPYENGAIFQHFGHSQQFKLYDAADGKVTASRVIGTNGQGHGALAGLLSQEKADVLICGGIGAGAQNALAAAGVRVFGGVSGTADEAVQSFLNGTLVFNPNVQCSHHAHGEGHSCGSHGCGEDKHGCAGNGCGH